jgi:tetratricopeptide (TPR) repeat protein
VRLEKPCLVYLRDDDVPILPKYVERDPDKLRLPDRWKQALNANHTVAKFSDWPGLAVQVAGDIGNVLLVKATAEAKGVAEAALREVLKRLGETDVAEGEIPDRLAKAADELLSLRADLVRLSNDRPEFATIRARASALIDKGDFDAARAALNEGRLRARAMREEMSRTEATFLRDEARVDRLQLNYEAVCAKLAEAARLDPENVWLSIELGDLWTTRGSLAEAKRAFSAARDAALRTGNDHDLSASYSRLGNIEFAQGDLTGALESYQDSYVIICRLAKSNPENPGWQRDLSVSYEKIGDVLVKQGDLISALKNYRASFAIIAQLRKSDPRNAGWQRHISVSYNKIGNVQRALSDLVEALISYRNGFDIILPLAQSDPSNTGWQRDLSVSYNKIGDGQRALGDLVEALASYRNGFDIILPLAQSTPATQVGSATFRCPTTGSATCRSSRVTSPARSPPIATASRSSTAWRNPIPAMPAGSANSRLPRTTLAMCRSRKATSLARSDPITTAWRSETAWRNPIPAMPAGSAISPWHTPKLATRRWRRTISPRG